MLRDDAPVPCCLEGTSGTSWTTGPGRGARGRRQGAAIARQLAQGLRKSTTQLAQLQPHRAPSVQNSPRTPLLTACAVQNSPCSPEMARFGAFSACRESFVPLWLAQHRAGRILYRMRGGDGARQHNNTPGTTGVKAPEGPEGSEEPQDPAAVPGAAGPGRGAGGCGGARPHYPQTTSAPSPSKFRMQFPHDTDRCTLKNRGISTIRLQYLKYTQGNCMRN